MTPMVAAALIKQVVDGDIRAKSLCIDINGDMKEAKKLSSP